jgi:hypothetical protein
MRALRSVAAFGAIGALIVCGASFSYAAEMTNERPFGGPFPPKKRGMERSGTTCKTPDVTCKFPDAKPIGSECFCQGSDGKPVKGKVAG